MTASELMKAMADAGAPFEAILIAMRALDEKDAEIAAKEAAAAEKRAKDAARKRDERASKDSPRTRRGQSKRPPKEELHTPEQSSPSGEDCLPKRKSAPLQFMPDDWEPILTVATQRLVDGWPPGMYDRQLSAFRNHAADKGRKSRDWQAAFRTWIDNADKWKPKHDGSPNLRTIGHSSHGHGSSLARAIDEGFANLGR